MLKIEKIKDEIKNFDMVNFGEGLACYLSRITTNKNYDGNCYRIGIECSECWRLSLLELLEEYKEPIKLTTFEYKYLKAAKKSGYNFIARDEDDILFLYKDNPWKCEAVWNSKNSNMFVFLELFNFVKWEDEEPYNIDEILSNCEVIEDGN